MSQPAMDDGPARLSITGQGWSAPVWIVRFTIDGVEDSRLVLVELAARMLAARIGDEDLADRDTPIVVTEGFVARDAEAAWAMLARDTGLTEDDAIEIETDGARDQLR